MSEKIFQGIKIAEFAWVVVGPSTSRYLAEHGATVVKIESHKRLDTIRATSPFANNTPTPDSSMFFGRHNPNKYSVTLDLQHPNGKKLALKLIEWADIVTESFSPGTMEKLGLDYENAKKVNPDIIYLSASMQGRNGPHSSYAGYGMNAVNLCGFTEVSGWKDKMPAAPHGAYTDYICARFNALALIAALDYRRRTGKGQWLEQSQFESSLHFFSPPLMDFQINGHIMERDGNRLPDAALHGVFPCKEEDSWIAIAIFSDEQWLNFCEVTGNQSWGKQKDFSTFEDRRNNEEKLEGLVANWTKNYTASQIETRLQNAGIPASIVEKPSDVYNDPQLKYRNYFIPLHHRIMGKQDFEPQSCFILSKTPRQVTIPSPCLGEHNEYVFKELLNMTDEEISEHIIDGSITTELPGAFNVSM